jgi:alkylated DNA repair dioxygenase AlkB
VAARAARGGRGVRGVEPGRLAQALVTEYDAGAAIGWHRDKGVFGDVVGVSLLAPCTFRLRRRAGAGWERATLVAAPRSAYLLRGPARAEWEHSIPPVAALRYSITFRSLRATSGAAGAVERAGEDDVPPVLPPVPGDASAAGGPGA